MSVKREALLFPPGQANGIDFIRSPALSFACQQTRLRKLDMGLP